MASGGHEAIVPAWDPPRPGEIIAGKYSVERVLGRGGMGIVVEARHIQLRSSVAIKILSPQALRLPGAVERFLREAQSAASLRSEHIGRVTDLGTLESGAPYLVMELLVGSDLQALLKRRGRLPPSDAVECLRQACEAIAEAHDNGIIHRDLKPANLFATTRRNGQPLIKVLDFGLAKVVDETRGGSDAALTATGVAAGSPFYMAPEQIRGLKLADARSDVWSLGVIAYELLTGSRPFRGQDTMGVLAAILTEEPPRLRTEVRDIPEALESVVLRCLQKNPTDRPQSVGELAGLLESSLAETETPPLNPAAGDGTVELATLPRAVTPVLQALPPAPPVDLVSEAPNAPPHRSLGASETTSQTTLTVGASEIQPPPVAPKSSRRSVIWLALLTCVILVISAIVGSVRLAPPHAAAPFISTGTPPVQDSPPACELPAGPEIPLTTSTGVPTAPSALSTQAHRGDESWTIAPADSAHSRVTAEPIRGATSAPTTGKPEPTVATAPPRRILLHPPQPHHRGLSLRPLRARQRLRPRPRQSQRIRWANGAESRKSCTDSGKEMRYP